MSTSSASAPSFASATATATESADAPRSRSAKERFGAYRKAHVEVNVATLDDLVKSYAENEVRADETYKGKPFSIAGAVDRVIKLDGRPVVVFVHTVEGDRYSSLMKSLFMGLDADDAASMATVAQLSPGDVVSMLCEAFTGLNDDVFTAKKCIVFDRVSASAIGSASAKP